MSHVHTHLPPALLSTPQTRNHSCYNQQTCTDTPRFSPKDHRSLTVHSGCRKLYGFHTRIKTSMHHPRSTRSNFPVLKVPCPTSPSLHAPRHQHPRVSLPPPSSCLFQNALQLEPHGMPVAFSLGNRHLRFPPCLHSVRAHFFLVPSNVPSGGRNIAYFPLTIRRLGRAVFWQLRIQLLSATPHGLPHERFRSSANPQAVTSWVLRYRSCGLVRNASPERRLHPTPRGR